jgi:hypothetical protein
MRRTATVLTLLLLLTASAWSACPVAPAGSTYVGTTTVSTSKTSGEVSTTATAPKKGEYSGEICIFRTATGEMIYLVDESTVTDGGMSTMSDEDMDKAVKALIKAAEKAAGENGSGIR